MYVCVYCYISQYALLVINSIGDIGGVKRNDYDNSVYLTSPTIEQCENVMSRLMENKSTGQEWSVYLSTSTPESTLAIINNLNLCGVWRLDILRTPLDSKCVSTLSEILMSNKTVRTLHLVSSQLTGGIKQVSDALFTNTTLQELWLSNVSITDEHTTHLSNMLSSNKTLKVLQLSNCNITDNGVQYICEGLTRNQTLITLNIGGNYQITSASTSTIVKLINAAKSLTELHLDHTSLKDDDMKIICTELANNTTIQRLVLTPQNKENFEIFSNYQFIKDRLRFWS